ncbi:MAG: BMP family ABC transporter substrate-binding protein [Candidatus Bathyarchaeia archaeon]
MPSTSRRNFLKYGLTGAVVAVVGGVGGYLAMTAGPAGPVGPAPKGTLKTALISSSFVTDLSFNQHGLELAQKAIENLKPAATEKGWTDIEFSYSENVAVADAERVMRDYIAGGVTMIWEHWGILHEDAIKRVAADHPDVMIASVCSAVPLAPNVPVYCAGAHEGAYLAGWLTGGLCEEYGWKKAGVMTAYKGVNCCDRVVAGYYYGFDGYNKAHGRIDKAEMVWMQTGTWPDVTKGYETFVALRDAGCGIIDTIGDGMSFGAMAAAKELNVPIVGHVMDQSPLAPDQVVTSIYWNFPMQVLLSDYINDSFMPAKNYLPGMAEGGSDIAPYHNWENKIPSNLKNDIAKIRETITSQSLAFVVPRIDYMLELPAAGTAPVPPGFM